MRFFMYLTIKRAIINSIFLHKYVFFVISSIVIVSLVYSIYEIRNGLFIKCTCWREVATDERALKYLPRFMNEFNHFTNRTAMEDAEEEHQSLAVRFLTLLEKAGSRCALLPGFSDIRHRNVLWQEAQVGTGTFLLFSAFLDLRDESEGPLIRILAMADSANPSTPTCHLYNYKKIGAPPVATRAVRVDFLHWQYPKKGEWHPFMITCRAPMMNSKFPDVVSLVSYPCSKATNALRVVHYDPSIQHAGNVALCHKFLFNPALDVSVRLVEWIEAARSWGIDHITFYHTSSHPNVEKVLSFYQKKKFVTVRPWMNPGTQVNVPSLLRTLFDTQRYVLFTDENIPYTDCFLHHLGSHEFVGIWDMDEFILPVTENSIPDLVEVALNQWKEAHKEDLTAKPPTSYLARASYFFDNLVEESFPQMDGFNHSIKESSSSQLPPYFHLLNHVERSFKFSPVAVYTKSIHATSRALGLHAHFALFNLEGEVDRDRDLYHLYPNSEGFLAHYREKCQGESQEICFSMYRSHLTRDSTMWKYFNQIYTSTQNTLSTLNLLKVNDNG